MSRLIDADALERDGWRMSRTVQIDEKTMEVQTRKPTNFPAVEPQPEPEEFEWCTDCKEYDQDKYCCHRWNKVIRETMEELKQAQPDWIPCSERMPEEKKDVLIAFKYNMAVGFWEDILDNGEPVWYVNSGDGWMTDTANVDSDGIPLAWMPLPTPWEGGQDEQTD